MSCIKASSAELLEDTTKREFLSKSTNVPNLVHKILALMALISRPAVRLTRDFPDSVHHAQLDLSK